MISLTEQIKQKAIELGFDKVGIAPSHVPSEEINRLHEWIHRRYHASMGWLARTVEKRLHPEQIVPGARTIISVATNYYMEAKHHSRDDAGKISRYAWGDDYHIHETKRIQKLFECIKQLEPEMNGRYYVDTGPVMDKLWAEQAGIGWRGKHTNVVTREYGSWVFLGEILTTLDLLCDSPCEDLCGTCTACIDACPTGAIAEPYVLDSNRCISYLTIEHRGALDTELASRFDRWIFGCDICQSVCPWNRFQQGSVHPEYTPREDNVSPRLDVISTMAEDEFRSTYARSAIKRAKLESLQRNVEIAKKNQIQKKRMISHDRQS